MKTRKVYIVTERNSHLVCYAERSKYGRHYAAQFYAPDHTIEEVQEYVRSRPELELVDSPPAITNRSFV